MLQFTVYSLMFSSWVHGYIYTEPSTVIDSTDKDVYKALKYFLRIIEHHNEKDLI